MLPLICCAPGHMLPHAPAVLHMEQFHMLVPWRLHAVPNAPAPLHMEQFHMLVPGHMLRPGGHMLGNASYGAIRDGQRALRDGPLSY